MRSDKYWANRAEWRMYGYIQDADRVADEIGKAYLHAANYLNEKSKQIFDSYRKRSGLSEAEAIRILNDVGNRTDLESLKKAYKKVKDPELRKQMLDVLNAPAYRARIQRLEALREELDQQCKDLYKVETQAIKTHLTSAVDNAYNRTMYDIQRGTGYGFSFAQMSAAGVDEILRNNWSGKLYSERVWGNTQAVAQLIKDELFIGQMVGKSNREMAAVVMEKMGVGAMAARRLVRTETCYVSNQAEMESYKECGIDTYRFVATLDSRTSEICASLDGKVFPVSKQQPGVNCPPMHPNCRSMTIADFDDDIMEGLKRRARDPVTGKNVIVPADMTYEEWRNLQRPNYLQISNADTAKSSAVSEIHRQLGLLPESHRAMVDKEVKEIIIVKEGNSRYNRMTKTMYILENMVPGEVVHECGHVLETVLGLHVGENERYDEIRKGVVAGKTNDDVEINVKDYGKTVYLLKSDRFISEYQGSLYAGFGVTDDDGNVNYQALLEYFSEGYKEYILNPENLAKADPELFEFIKELI